MNRPAFSDQKNSEIQVINLSVIESAVLKDVLSREPKGTLYHYTTQAGLLGIIKDRPKDPKDQPEIWATHTQYLNDATEYCRAVDAVTSEISRRLDVASGDSSRILTDMAQGVKGLWGRGDQWINVCVTSFSEDRDSLSLWRAYGGSHSGCAIGFNSAHLAQMVRRGEFCMARCLYKYEREWRGVTQFERSHYTRWKPSMLPASLCSNSQTRVIFGGEGVENHYTPAHVHA